METLSDGSVTLSKREWAELGRVVADMYDFMCSFPSDWEDAFPSKARVWAVRRWLCYLRGEPFRKSDWQ